MQIVHDAYASTDLPAAGVAAIGNFDGLHRGQREVLERVRRSAAELAVPAAAITFEPHPVAVLRPESAPDRLATPERKLELFEELGLDVALVVRFSEEFSRTPAEEFVRDFLHRRLGLAEIYVGERFSFGHRRRGDLQMLQRLGDELGFAAHGVEPLRWRGERISSTRIRQALSEGRAEDAEEMLARPYDLGGVVVRGDRMGQKIGWPTINLDTDDQLVPLDGVYAGRVHIPSYPATFECVSNIGTRPTVYENFRRVVESHILDFDADVYGERVRLSFHKRLREEMIFPSIMDLSAQIGRDVESTREYFLARRQSEERERATGS